LTEKDKDREDLFNRILGNPVAYLGRELIVESVTGAWYLWKILGIDTREKTIHLFCLRNTVTISLGPFKSWTNVTLKE